MPAKNEQTNEQPSKISYMKFTKMDELVYRIKAGDRIPGDELGIALREHADGPLPEIFLNYLETPLSGWKEKKPGQIPKSVLFTKPEKIFLKMQYHCIKFILNENHIESYELTDIVNKHLPDIDESFSVSEKASRLVGIIVYGDQRKGPGIMNKIFSSN